MDKQDLDAHISQFEKGIAPVPFEINVKDQNLHFWVRFKVDPKRFTPAIFDGEWALTKQHPSVGSIRVINCLLYTSPSPRDGLLSRMPSSA